jgi:hypothetical protein
MALEQTDISPFTITLFHQNSPLSSIFIHEVILDLKQAHGLREIIMTIKNEELKVEQLICLIAGWFWVTFLWGFWEKGVYALGLNATLFALLSLAIIGRFSLKESIFAPDNRPWSIPITAMAFSFVLYENPFFEIIQLIAFPVAILWFVGHARTLDGKSIPWSLVLINKWIFGSLGLVLGAIKDAASRYLETISSALSINKEILARSIKGLLSLIVLWLIIIPLLSSADPVFAERIEGIWRWIEEIFAKEVIYKIILVTLISLVYLASVITLSNTIHVEPKIKASKDTLSTSIVLLGGLLTYAMFLLIQFERLWIDSLPLDFKATETLVKTGFWQLMFVSIINIVLFLGYYKRTNHFGEVLLSLFAFTSLLMLLSAGHRLFLYVVYYGFSYEKFYASYTVIYLSFLLSYLVWTSLQNQSRDVLKTAAYLLLWMYALVAIFPTEQFVLRANLELRKLDGSRISIRELQMLSSDVLALAKNYYTNELLAGQTLLGENPVEYDELGDWSRWITRNERIVESKKWYEMTLSDLKYRISPP